MTSQNLPKDDFSILPTTEFQEVDNYLLLKDGFNISKNQIQFNIKEKELVDKIKDKYKVILYRLKFNQFSKFFFEEDLVNQTDTLLTSYTIINTDPDNQIIQQRVPLNTKIKFNENDSRFNLNNFILSISYDDTTKNLFEIDYMDENKTIIYISDTNTIVFRHEDKFINIKDAIKLNLLTYSENYSYTLLDNTIEVKDAILYKDNVIGKIENINRIFTTDTSIPAISIHGLDIKIDNGLSANLKTYEDVTYYENLNKIVTNENYDEFNDGDIIYFQDVNKVYVCKIDGLKEIKLDSITYDVNPPNTDIVGAIWFDTSLGILRIYDGMLWINMNSPSLNNVVIKMNIEKKLKDTPVDCYLEVFGYNENSKLKIVEMITSNSITKDIQFDLGDSFVESVYINGDEIYSYSEAKYGIMLHDTAFKGDLLQLIVIDDKQYDWVNAVVEDENTILIAHPREVSSIKKVIVNSKLYRVNNINQNRVETKDLVSVIDNEPLILNQCDKIRAQVKLSKKLSKVYPHFTVEYKDGIKEVEIPFNLAKSRFNNLMITNNGKNVIVNPQTILEQDRLYAYYNPKEKVNIIGFSRAIRQDENIVIQFINTNECIYNSEILFENIQSEKDILDKIILDGLNSFEDDSISLKQYENEIDEIVNKSENEINKIPTINNMPTFISGAVTENSTEQIDNILNKSVVKASPDYTDQALVNKLVPTKSKDPILVKPSSTYVRPVVQVIRKRQENYSKYNLWITREYFKLKEKLRKYLQAASDRFAKSVRELSQIRDTLRSMINYICNTLCLAEMLRFIEMMFKSIASALTALLTFNIEEFVKKITEKIKKLIATITDTLGDILQVLGESLGGLTGMALAAAGKVLNTISSALESVDNLIDAANKKIDEIASALDKVSSLFSEFQLSKIGLFIGNFFGKMFKKLMTAINKIMKSIMSAFNAFYSMLTQMMDLLANFNLDMFKNFTFLTNIADIIDFICNKVLKSLLSLLDNIVDLLDYLQKRFQDLIDALFADRYRCKLNVIDRLQNVGDFFKSHVDICYTLRSMIDQNDLSIAGFLKKATNLEQITERWNKNKKMLKEALKPSNRFIGNACSLADTVVGFENALLTVDDLFGNNSLALDKLVRKIKNAFIPTFKNKTESVMDIQTYTKAVYRPEKYREFQRKLSTL